MIFLIKNLQEVAASNSVRRSNTSSPQPNGEIANILLKYILDKQQVEKNLPNDIDCNSP